MLWFILAVASNEVALTVAGWALGKYAARIATIVANALATIMLFTTSLLFVTGWLHSRADWIALTHRFSAHGLVIVAWLAVPLAIGVVASISNEWHLISRIAAVFLILVTMLLVLWTSFTGYLYPEAEYQYFEETRNRFWVLHGFVMPVATAATLLGWLYVFWPRKSAASPHK